jgi:hypothetical protein
VTGHAQKWLQHAEIGRNTPHEAAMQLEAFTVAGFAERIEKKTKESKYYFLIVSYSTQLNATGPARIAQWNARGNCRKLIQDGLGESVYNVYGAHANTAP